MSLLWIDIGRIDEVLISAIFESVYQASYLSIKVPINMDTYRTYNYRMCY